MNQPSPSASTPSVRPLPGRIPMFQWIVAIIAVTSAAYLPALNRGFIWDDDDYVTNNPTLRTADGLRRIWTEPGATPQFYPLTFTTFWVEARLWGASWDGGRIAAWRPGGFHATNIALHALSAVLVALVLQRLGLRCAWLAALLFALHPVHVESVAWITERKNVLSAALALGALLAYLRFLGDARARRSWPHYALALALFAAALLSKSVTATLPAAVLVILWWRNGRLRWADVTPLVPFLAIGMAAGGATAWMETYNLRGMGVGAAGEEWALSPVQRLLIAGRAPWFYAGKLVWPQPLTFIYPRWQVDAAAIWQWLYPLATVGVLAALFRYRGRIGRGPLAAALLFVGTLFPVLGFLNVYPFRYSFVADHFQYLPSLALLVPAAVLLQRAFDSASAGVSLGSRALTAMLLIALGVRTHAQVTRYYADEETLWNAVLQDNPQARIAHNNLAMIQLGRGNADRAIESLEAALRLDPALPESHFNLAAALIRQQRFDEAREHLEEAIRLRPRYAEAHVNLGNLLATIGRPLDAIAHYHTALEVAPQRTQARFNLAVALSESGGETDALAELEQVLREKPDLAHAYLLKGRILEQQGDMAAALAALRAGVKAAPDNDDLKDALWKAERRSP